MFPGAQESARLIRIVMCEPVSTLTIADAPMLTCGRCSRGTHTLVSRSGVALAVCPECYRGEHFLRHYGRQCVSEW